MSSAVHRVTELSLARPLDAYVRAFPRGRGTFLLDGAGGPAGAALATTALFGAEPVARFRATRSAERTTLGTLRAEVVVTRGGAEERSTVDDPLAVLRALLRDFAVSPDALAPGLPFRFRAGAVGYVAYEAGQMLERLPCRPRPRDGLPDIAFDVHDWVLGQDRRTGRTFLSVVGRGATSAEAEASAAATLSRVRAALHAVPRAPDPEARAPRSDPASDVEALSASLGARRSLGRDAYLDAVARAKDHIDAGDAFEICLTNAFDIPFTADPFALWQDLRRHNPSPFAAFLDLPEAAIVSSSPERFLTLDEERVAESRPIKGTRPRGRGVADDERLAEDLAASEKDRAENTMIVDLVRNDLGRVCRYGSVHVPGLCAIERHPTVLQMVSTVRGRLEDGSDALDLVRACFPPGSMTGAPKIEAMTVLEELEPVERGIYSGALGWIDVTGTLDLSVVIRTAVVRRGSARVSVGGAVVADSEPAEEHAEALVKARALFESLDRTRRSP